MADFSGISGGGLGSIRSSLGSYNGSRSSGGSGGGGGRSNQLVSLSLSEFVNTDVDDYERAEQMANPDDIEINRDEGKSIWEKFGDWASTGIGTVVVGATSVLSGVADVFESVWDGGAYVVQLAASGLGELGWEAAGEFAESTREFIARDLVSEANDALYGEGGALQWANDASALKYDSAAAQGIRKTTAEVTKYAAATAATVCTGGAVAPIVAPLALGFASGMGEKSEQLYQEKGTDLSVRDNIGIVVAGLGEAANWYAKGKLGQGALKAFGAIKEFGIGKTFGALSQATKSFFSQSPKHMIKSLGNIFKGTFNKTNLSRAVSKSVRDLNNIFESAGIIADDVSKWINGDEKFNVENVLRACGELGITWIGNVTFDALGEYATKAKRVDDIPGMADGQRKNLDSIFDTEHQVADGKYEGAFKTYREHAELHTQAVRDYAVMLGLDLDSLDDKALAEIYYGAYFHDLGMAGGGVDADDMIYGMAYDKKHQFVGFLDDVSPGDGFTARKNHPLNSAISVLSTDLVPEGLDKDKIALLALSHSKSTSGITSFADPSQWMSAIDELEDAVNQYNIKNGLTGASAITFDADKLRRMVSDSSDFQTLVDQALCIRDGDAMSNLALDSGGHTIMQTGNVAHIDSPSLSYDQVISKSDELAGVTDVVKTPDGEVLFTVDDEMGKLFHAGEENVNFDSVYDGKTYTGRVELVDPHKVPNSSIFNIEERLGEAVTYTNCDRSFIVDIPSDMAHTPMGDMYVEQLKTFAGGKIADADAAIAQAKLDLAAGKITQSAFDQIQTNNQSIKDFFTSGVEVNGYGVIGFTPKVEN